MLYHIERTGVNLLPQKEFEMYRLAISIIRTTSNFRQLKVCVSNLSISFNNEIFKWYQEKSKNAV